MIKNDPFTKLQDATKKAFQQFDKVSQVETDPDLQLYSTLKPEHFQELMKVFGEQDVLEYIKAMESKRLNRKEG